MLKLLLLLSGLTLASGVTWAGTLADTTQNLADQLYAGENGLSQSQASEINTYLRSIQRVIDSSSGGGGGGNTGDIEKRYTPKIDGGLVSGTSEDSKQRALSSYERACDDFIEGNRVYNRRIESISCGNRTETGGSNGYRYESTALLVMKIPADATVKSSPISGIPVTGTTEESKNAAFQDYQQRCTQNRYSFGSFRGVFYFDCGATRETGGSNGYRYESTGTLTYNSHNSGERQEQIQGDSSSGTDANSQKTAYDSWTKKCERWLGIQQIGNTVVAFCGAPSEVGGSSAYRYISTGTIVLGE